MRRRGHHNLHPAGRSTHLRASRHSANVFGNMQLERNFKKWALTRISQSTEMGNFYNYFLFSIVALTAEGLSGESASSSGTTESFPLMPECRISPTESQLHHDHVAVSLAPPEEVVREGRCFLACASDEVSNDRQCGLLNNISSFCKQRIHNSHNNNSLIECAPRKIV